MLTPPAHLSPSSINTFQQCPLKFKYSRIDGLSEPPTIHTLLGNFVHEILEHLYALPADERTQNSARVIARERWSETYEPQAKSMRLNERDFRWKAWWCVENLWKVEDPQTVELTGLEQEVTATCSGVLVKGFIDRYKVVDGNVHISDYKTGKVPDARFLDDKFQQLLIYALMVRERGVGEPTEMSLMYLAGPKVLSRNVTQEGLDQTTEMLVNTKKQIDAFCEEGDFPVKTSGLCNWCYFKKICPAWTR